jgi:DNA polymerase III subunit gamma/tau
MAHYQSLARQYRPQTFADVCDQKAIVSTLKNALSLHRVSHAYLFCGSRGVGKTTLARLFSKVLNCQHVTPDIEPCNTCSSCREITAGQSLDVIEIDGASNRGIDDIRQLNETILYSPSHARYKIYIIDEVHMLTKEAFNALLKTLEEPPKNVKFFFATTEPHKVLPTILSRCQRFDLHRISLESMCRKLTAITSSLNVTLEEEARYTLAKCADGSLRDALSLLDQVLCTQESHITFSHVATLLGLPSYDSFFLLDQAFHIQDLRVAFRLAYSLYEEGKDLLHFIEMLAEHYQRILKYHLGVAILHTLPTSYQEHYSTAFKIYSQEQTLYILEYLMQWIDKFHKLPCKHIHLELILAHIIRSKGRVALSHLVKTLQELKQQQESHPPERTTSIHTATPALEPACTSEHQLKPEPPIKPISQQSPLQSTEAPLALEQLQRHETLLRFAAVELNGVLKKPEFRV